MIHVCLALALEDFNVFRIICGDYATKQEIMHYIPRNVSVRPQ